MPRLLPVALVLLLAPLTLADDWTGRSVKPKQDGLKLGRKFGGGLVLDGTALDKAKTYPVKSDDGTHLELAGGFVFKSDFDVIPEPPKKVTNPEFTAWNKFPKGTAVVIEESGEGSGVTDQSAKKWKGTVTHTLVEVTADQVVVEIVSSGQRDDQNEKTVSRKETHPRLIDAPPPPYQCISRTTTESEETITVADTKYKAKKVRVKDTSIDAEGSVFVEDTWYSDDVPGRFLSQESSQTGTYWFDNKAVLKSVTIPKK